jgi:hypothetical protein
MDLQQILQVFETILNAALKGGLFSHHAAAKQAIIARDELAKHAAAPVIQPAATKPILTAKADEPVQMINSAD